MYFFCKFTCWFILQIYIYILYIYCTYINIIHFELSVKRKTPHEFDLQKNWLLLLLIWGVSLRWWSNRGELSWKLWRRGIIARTLSLESGLALHTRCVCQALGKVSAHICFDKVMKLHTYILLSPPAHSSSSSVSLPASCRLLGRLQALTLQSDCSPLSMCSLFPMRSCSRTRRSGLRVLIIPWWTSLLAASCCFKNDHYSSMFVSYWEMDQLHSSLQNTTQRIMSSAYYCIKWMVISWLYKLPNVY